MSQSSKLAWPIEPIDKLPGDVFQCVFRLNAHISYLEVMKWVYDTCPGECQTSVLPTANSRILFEFEDISLARKFATKWRDYLDEL